MTKQLTMTPAEQLKKKLYKIKFSEDLRETKKDFDSEEFVRMAKEVRKTFKDDERILPSNSNF